MDYPKLYTASKAGAKKAFEGSNIQVLAFKDASWEEDKAKVVMADLIACTRTSMASGATVHRMVLEQ